MLLPISVVGRNRVLNLPKDVSLFAEILENRFDYETAIRECAEIVCSAEMFQYTGGILR